jgi:hypothetical protein
LDSEESHTVHSAIGNSDQFELKKSNSFYKIFFQENRKKIPIDQRVFFFGDNIPQSEMRFKFKSVLAPFVLSPCLFTKSSQHVEEAPKTEHRDRQILQQQALRYNAEYMDAFLTMLKEREVIHYLSLVQQVLGSWETPANIQSLQPSVRDWSLRYRPKEERLNRLAINYQQRHIETIEYMRHFRIVYGEES